MKIIKVIKVMELLNMMAKNKMPKHIAYRKCNYTYNEKEEDYLNDQVLGVDGFLDKICTTENLNDYVQIIEKDKKIKYCRNYENFESIDDYIEHLRYKIDELINIVNELEGKSE